MASGHRVTFYLDFISPYAWLALADAEGFAREHDVRWVPTPVVYGAVLDASGLVGPAEVPSKREYTFHDVARCAASRGLRLEGPPRHPFRSLEALRTLTLYRDDPRALALAVRLSHTCWAEGRDLEDLAVLAEVVDSVGLSGEGLAERIAEPEVKLALRQATEGALRLGVFGVPTFVYDGELFWGHDRMGLLADRLAGRLPVVGEAARKILDRPRGVDRKGAPGSG